MRCAFIADTVLLKKGKDYYGMTLTYDFLLKRYLHIIDELIVITRVKNIKDDKGDISGYKKVNGKNIIVSPIEKYKEIPDAIKNKHKINNELKQKLLKCDKAIIRLPNVLGLKACKICQKISMPYIVEMLACPWDGYRNHTNSLGKIIAPFMYLFNKKEIKKASQIVYVTNNFLQKRYPTKGKSFSCSDVELKTFSEKTLNNKITQYKNINLKNLTFCTVANIEMKYKGHLYAFKTIKKLKQQNYIIKYYLVGNGDKKRLQKLANKLQITNNIEFVGSLNHDQVFNMLDKIDIYIQPSLQEGLPRALIEAMSRACFCIGSNIGGIPELLNKKYIFKAKKYKQIIKIINSLTTEDLVNEAQNNFNKSKEYNSKNLNKKRDKIYLDFINKNERKQDIT